MLPREQTSFDNECLAGQSVLAARLYGSDDGSSSTASKYGSVKKIERVTLAELNNYVLNSPPQTAKFLCTAEVGDIDTTNGWCYFSYSKCYQKLQRGFTVFHMRMVHDDTAVCAVSHCV